MLFDTLRDKNKKDVSDKYDRWIEWYDKIRDIKKRYFFCQKNIRWRLKINKYSNIIIYKIHNCT